jgi:hypothetical protein
MSRLSIVLFFIILTGFALAKVEKQGFKLSPAQLLDEVSQIDQILQKEHSERKIKSPAKIENGLLLRRIFLSAVGRIPTLDEYQKWLNSDDSLNKEALVDHLILSEAYSSQMFNWWADHLRAKSNIMGQANQIGAGFLYVDWLKTQVSENVPYDEMARLVVASEGYPWENGAVGYYLRDDGMPLENMSNTAELFLGTQLVCAQCHNHPFDKWTQMEYYQMAAHTYGVVTRMQGSTVEEIKKLAKDFKKSGEGMQMMSMTSKPDQLEKQARAFRQAVQDMLLPLQFGARHKDRKLKLPHDYKYDDGKPHQVIQPGVIFKNDDGLNSSGSHDLVTQYAHWMTSPQNPRFTKVVVNRIWKKIFGRGLVEPLNDWREDSEASMPKLLEHLSKLLVRLDYDLREFQRVLLNLNIFENQALDQELEPLAHYYFQAPTLQRMSAEQLWDSLLTLLVPEIDYRQQKEGVDFLQTKKANLEKYRLKVEGMSSEELFEVIKEGRKQIVEIQEEMNSINAQIKDAVEQDDRESVSKLKRLQNEMRDNQRSALATQIMGDEFNVYSMYKNYPRKRKGQLSPEEKTFPSHLRRASEQNSPANADHFLREFGQSDRDLIDNSRKEASIPQVLNLMNGNLRWRLIDKHSPLAKAVIAEQTLEQKIKTVYQAMLQRLPTKEEIELCLNSLPFPNLPNAPVLKESYTPKKKEQILQKAKKQKEYYQNKVHNELRHLAWALLNTREFSFIQ